MSIIVCGGAGFIGVNLLDSLLELDSVYVVDNLCRGSKKYLEKYGNNPNFHFIEHELSDVKATEKLFVEINNDSQITEVWHMAANSDILAGVKSPDIDLTDTFMTTHAILMAMRETGAKNLYFASSSAIYGDMGGKPVREDSGPLLPISNYGAMKLASEALISASAESFLDAAIFFRFPNVVGIPATHGVIFDLVRKLKRNPDELEVLGNGTQRKSYLHVSDLVQAMFHLKEQHKGGVDIFNIGPVDEGAFVKQIAEEVTACVAPNAHIAYGTENRGWVGDVPKFMYSVEKLSATGWQPALSSLQAVQRAVNEIAEQEK